MGHHLYDENKRLRAENDAMREQLREKVAVKDHDVVLDGITGFFQGTARIIVQRNGDDFSILFQH